MKRKFWIAGIFLTALLCAGCGNNGKRSEKDVQDETAETKEYDPLAGYKESNSPEAFGAEVSFEITGELNQKVPDDLYSNTHPDGSISLYLFANGGTPYQIEGPVYDHEMFSMRTYVKLKEGKEDGGGYVECQYWFTPNHAGETEIMTLESYAVDSIYTGTLYHITVDDDLTCSLDWYAGVSQGENMELVGLSPEEWPVRKLRTKYKSNYAIMQSIYYQ